MTANGDFVRSYLAALEAGAQGDDLARFFDPEVEQIEYPNRLMPNGAKRNLAQLLEGAARGAKVTRAQSFTISKLVEEGETVVAEFDWWAELTMPIGSLPAGGRMTGKYCAVIELRGGRIWRQRNYDCFDPF